MIKAIFLDRDGTLVKDFPDKEWSDIEHLEIFDDTIDALKKIPKDFKLFIVTNQYLIDEGYITYSQFKDAHKEFIKKLSENSIDIEHTYYCPHTRNSNCGCCKPEPGMIQQCLVNYDIDMNNSYLVGNSVADIKLAQNVGLKSILVRDRVEGIEPTYRADNLLEIISIISA